MPGGRRHQAWEARPESRVLWFAGWAAVALWLLSAFLLTLTPVSDSDLAFHIAWGRILLHDFAGARSLTLGQDHAVTVYAYSYWLYQVAAAGIFDHLGPRGLVVVRELMVLGALALAFLLAGRLGASLWSRSALLAFGVLVAQERFVDRPDVFSTLAWTAALWIFVVHRRGRGVWALVPLQIVWVNTHLFFSLLPLGYAAFAAADYLDGTSRDIRRAALVLGALIAASFVGPAGPGAWASQLRLAGFASGVEAPVKIEELMSPYANYKNFLAVWAFRFGMPMCVIACVAARKRIGLGAVLAMLLPAALAVLARRTMAMFAITAVIFAPVGLDLVVSRLRARPARVVRIAVLAVTLLAGLAGVLGLLDGRVMLAEDKPFRVGDIGKTAFEGEGGARFLRTEAVQGPILHNPVFAGAILLENGTRLEPFVDARWLGTKQSVALYRNLRQADDVAVGAIWDAAQKDRGFETVMLDSYEMPALLRHVYEDPGWALVFVDDTAAVFCRRGGPNDGVIAERAPAIEAARAKPDPGREAVLADLVIRFLRAPGPSFFTSLRFPLDAFRLGNFALQTRDRPDAQAAYVELFRRERGSLQVSPHRTSVLRNTLWCLAESPQWEARAALCALLEKADAAIPKRRIAMRIGEAQALLQLGRNADLERAALDLARDPAAGPDDRWWAWTCVAGAREASGDDEGTYEALRTASGFRPNDAGTVLSMAKMLDLKLHRIPEALQAYEKYRALGGADPSAEERIRSLRANPNS